MSSLLKTTLNTRALPIGGMRYIRSDAPLSLTEDEIRWLLDNNISTLVDLRSMQETEHKPCPLKDVAGFTYYHLPVTGGGDTPRSREHIYEVYQGMVDSQMDIILETIINAPTNVMYFCTAGKDRTGVVSALLLKKLGVSEDVIVEIQLKDHLTDYEGILVAWSAGSMNCADMVYVAPELEGEATDSCYERWIPGLGITNINIFLHFQSLRNKYLNGMRLIEDITYQKCQRLY